MLPLANLSTLPRRRNALIEQAEAESDWLLRARMFEGAADLTNRKSILRSNLNARAADVYASSPERTKLSQKDQDYYVEKAIARGPRVAGAAQSQGGACP